MVLIPTGGYDSHSLLIVEGCRFSGVMDATAPNVLLKKNVFEGDVMLTKSGGNSDLSHGGNVYLAPANFTNTSTTGQFRLGGGDSDYYHENVTFNSDTLSLIAGNKTFSYFYKNVTVNSPKVYLAYAVWSGDVDQQMEGTATQAYLKLHIEKPNGKAVAQTPIAITGHVKFVNGHLETDSTNIITFLAGSGAIDASNKSFVSGPVKKVGDTAFEFPVGKGGHYRPLGISAPDSVTDTFVGEYFDEEQLFGSVLDTSLLQISECNYWILHSLSGNSSVNYSLTWNQNFCWEFDTTYMNIASYDSGQWNNLGHGTIEGNILSGRLTTTGSHQGDRILTLSLNSSFPIFIPDLGLAAGYGVLSDDSVITNAFHIIGKAGATGNIDSILTATDSINTNGVGSVPLSIAALDSIINYLDTIAGTVLNNSLDDISLFHGVYEISGNAYLNDTLKLFGDSNSVFVFKITDSLVVDTQSSLKLHGVHPRNVYWKADSGVYINSNDRFFGVIISGGTSHIENNGGQIAVLGKGAVQIINNEPYNYTNHIRAAELMSMPSEFLFASPCTGPEFDCNLIINPGFESGSVPNDQDGFEEGWVDCWTNQVCQHSSGCNNPGQFSGSNTPDIMDEDAPVGNGFRPCDNSNPPFMYDSFSIPENTMAANTPSLTPSFYGIQSNQNDRYATMFTGETIGAELKEPISPGFYVVGFWARATDCFCPGQLASVCITLYDNTSCSQLRNLGDINLLGVDNTQWTFYAECIDLTTGNVGQFNHLGFKMTFDNRTMQCPTGQALFNGRIFVDDFVFFKVADAGPDLYTCGNPIQLEPPCENPYFTYSYDWQVFLGPGATPDPVMNPWVNPSGTTTYEVTVTITGPNNFTCIDVDQVTVNTVSNLSLGLTSTNSCSGSTGSISSTVTGGTPPYQYLWSTGSTAANLNNLPSGTYTVTVTDANGCSATASATVLEDDTEFTITGPAVNCDTVQVDLNFTISPYNSSNAAFYTWSASPGLTLVDNGNGTATVTFAAYTGGSVTVMYSNQGCVYQYTHYIQECCYGIEFNTTVVNALSSELPNLIGAGQSGNLVTLGNTTVSFYFNGTLTLNTDLKLLNLPNLLFGPGAVIIVPPSFTLIIDNSVLRAGCDAMWKGIEVDGPSGMVLITSSDLPNVSRIEDAQYGIQILNRGNYQIKSGTVFDKNYIGMQVIGPLFQQRYIKDSEFQCSANLLPPFPGQVPVPCSRTFAGIELIDVTRSITIGDPTFATDPMIFNQINIGIHSLQSSLNVFNCEFTNIRQTGNNVCFTPTTAAYRGSGIAQIGFKAKPASILYQRGFGSGVNDPLSFDDCTYGIYAVHAGIDVRNNHMDNVNIGIHEDLANRYFQSRMFGNRLYVSNTGVRVVNPNASSEVKVYDNTIFVNSTSGVGQNNFRSGIRVYRDGVTFSPNWVSVRQNDIQIDNGRFGILIENIENTDALSNGITINDGGTAVKRGLSLTNLVGHRSGCNIITHTGSENYVGIHGVAIPNAIVGCNHTFDFHRGIQLAGNSINLQFLGNEMNDGNTGLFLFGAPTTVIGPQINHGNQWLGTFGASGASLQSGNLINPNIFRVEGTNQQPLWPPNPNPSSGWFIGSSCTNCTFDCDDSPQWVCDGGPYIYERTSVTVLDSMIVNGDSLSELWVEETIRQSRRILYEVLLSNDTLREGNQLLEDFFTDHADSAYAKFAEIRYILSTVIESNQSLYNSALSLSQERDSIMVLLQVNDSIFCNGISGNDSLDLLDENESLRNMIYEIELELEPLEEQLKDSIDATVLSVSQLNDVLESVSDFDSELNEYHVNKISFDIYLEERDTLKANEISILENIIFQCPSSGGKAVFEARGLYNRFVNDSIDFDDDSLCVPPSRLMATVIDSPEPSKKAFCKIYPNPTNETLLVEILIEDTDDALRLILTDISGRKVMEVELEVNSSTSMVDVSKLKEGVYLCKIQHGGKEILYNKLVIVR
jgi:hypothetical protein